MNKIISQLFDDFFEIEDDFRNGGPFGGAVLPAISDEGFGSEIESIGYFGSGLFFSKSFLTLFEGLFPVDFIIGDNLVEDHSKGVDISLFIGFNCDVIFISEYFSGGVHGLVGIASDKT